MAPRRNLEEEAEDQEEEEEEEEEGETDTSRSRTCVCVVVCGKACTLTGRPGRGSRRGWVLEAAWWSPYTGGGAGGATAAVSLCEQEE